MLNGLYACSTTTIFILLYAGRCYRLILPEVGPFFYQANLHVMFSRSQSKHLPPKQQTTRVRFTSRGPAANLVTECGIAEFYFYAL